MNYNKLLLKRIIGYCETTPTVYFTLNNYTIYIVNENKSNMKFIFSLIIRQK